MIKRLICFTFLVLIITNIGKAQIPKRSIVEHITNTRCSVCANTNPKFFNYYQTQTEFSHISYHPSSPYSSCVLNKHNVGENDDRVKFYNAYGSTPKFIINGNVLPTSSNYSSASTYQPYLTDSTEVDVRISSLLYNTANDSIIVKATVKSIAQNNLGQLQLFIALAEDTVFYNAPNGENIHQNVFRKAFTSVEGESISPPQVNDSITYRFSIALNAEWDVERINVFAILQEAQSKNLVQSHKTTELMIDGVISNNDTNDSKSFSVFPNPVNQTLYFNGNLVGKLIKIYSIEGKLMKEQILRNSSIDVSELKPGIYFLKDEEKLSPLKFIKL